MLVDPRLEWERVRLGVVGVEVPADSARSEGPAQARKTASRIEGVKRERVRWESVRAARRNRFFCEKRE